MGDSVAGIGISHVDPARFSGYEIAVDVCDFKDRAFFDPDLYRDDDGSVGIFNGMVGIRQESRRQLRFVSGLVHEDIVDELIIDDKIECIIPGRDFFVDVDRERDHA